eukprot:4561-Prymnesium_polylepis.2
MTLAGALDPGRRLHGARSGRREGQADRLVLVASGDILAQRAISIRSVICVCVERVLGSGSMSISTVSPGGNDE